MPSAAKGIWHLVAKDIKLEWREKYALSGILLYVLSTAFVIYSVFQSVDPFTWVSLYWIITLFAAINAASRSFITENQNIWLYYYLLASPQQIILSKMLFNSILLLVLSIASNAVFALLLGFNINGVELWLVISLLGGLGFALAFTMISAIAAKARNAGVLMTILGLPIMIPQLLLLVKLSKQAVAGALVSSVTTDLLALVAIDIILVAVALVFFPFLWKD